jgi:hypothetical protein
LSQPILADAITTSSSHSSDDAAGAEAT